MRCFETGIVVGLTYNLGNLVSGFAITIGATYSRGKIFPYATYLDRFLRCVVSFSIVANFYSYLFFYNRTIELETLNHPIPPVSPIFDILLSVLFFSSSITRVFSILLSINETRSWKICHTE